MAEREPFAEGQLQLGLAGEGSLRWAVADVTEVMETARRRLDLSPVAAAALGRSVAGAALLLRLAAKRPTRLTLELRGDGPLGRVLAQADEEGNVRGTVGNPLTQVPDTAEGKLAVGRAVGQGFLRVLREHGAVSYDSQVELVSGEVAADLSHFLAQSEQTQSAVLLGVLGRPSGIAAAGGVIVEVLPGADPEHLETLERNVSSVGGVSRLIEASGLGGVLDVLLAGLSRQVLEQRKLYYRCHCSRDRLYDHLVMLSDEDRDYLLQEDRELVADCAFCGAQYRFSVQELTPQG